MNNPEFDPNDKARIQAMAKYTSNAKKSPHVLSFFWLLRFADVLNKYTDIAVAEKGDYRTGIAVLQVLLQYPDGVSQQDIANRTGRTKQAIVIAIDKLEQKGYVRRCVKDSDRRVNYINITQEGIDHLNEVFPHTLDMCNKGLSSLSDAEIEKLLSLVKKLTKSLYEKIKA